MRELGNLYWSSCPDTDLIRAVAKRGVTLVVDLTENECNYEAPSSVERMEYPIPDFSYVAFESVLTDVVIPVLKRLERGEKVLIHCRGGIGRSGVTVAMVVGLRDGLNGSEVERRLAKHGFAAITLSQAVAFRWFFRARDLVGVDWIYQLVERSRSVRRGALSYWSAYGNHASTVAGVALDVLKAVADRFGLSNRDLTNAYAAGLVHDVGRVLTSEEQHHIAGADFALQLAEVKARCDPEVVSKAVYHHRRETDLLGDRQLRELGFGAQLVAAAVRLADSFDDVYRGEGIYRSTELEGSELTLFLSPQAWVLPLNRLEEKARAFTELTRLKVRTELA